MYEYVEGRRDKKEGGGKERKLPHKTRVNLCWICFVYSQPLPSQLELAFDMKIHSTDIRIYIHI